MTRLDLLLVSVLLGTRLVADPLPDMGGDWSGSGTAREYPGSPEEAVRCRLTNEWQAERRRLRIRGRCAVPGRAFDIDGALQQENGAESLSGFWRNPDGPGQTSLSGRVFDDSVRFAFRAEAPGSGRDVSQVITLRIDADTLRLISRALADDSELADIEFRR